MPYRGHTRFACKVCGRPRDPSERFSARGKCPDCGDERMLENHRAMLAHAGPYFDHWRRRCLAAFGVVVDERADEG